MIPTHRHLERPHRPRVTAARALCAAVCLLTCSSVIGQDVVRTAKPEYVNVRLGKLDTWIEPGSEAAEDRAVKLALDLVQASYRAREGAAVIMRVTDYAVSFDALKARQQSRVMMEIGQSDNLQDHYEQAVAWLMQRSVEMARGTADSTEFGFAGIPLEMVEDSRFKAGQTNSNYASALAEADVLLTRRAFISFGTDEALVSQVRDALGQTCALLQGRPLLVEVNGIWHRLAGPSGDDASIPSIDSATAEMLEQLFDSIQSNAADPVAEILKAWSTGDSAWDVNRDSSVDPDDLAIMLDLWHEFAGTDSNDDPTDGGPIDIQDGNPTDPIDTDPTDTTNTDPTDQTDSDPIDIDPTDGSPIDDDGPDLGVARFAENITTYQQQSTGDLTLQLYRGAPARPNVVFQTWSSTAGSIQSPVVDTQEPFVYPGAALNQVSAGAGEIQAIVRDDANQVLEIVKMTVTFEPADTDTDTTGPTDGDPTDTTNDDPTDTTDTTDDDPSDTTDDDPTDTTDTTDGDGPDDTTGGDVLAPEPVVSIISQQGQAPFTVHVHGLETQLYRGDALTARYQWDFDDPDGTYNTLVGWNAAHTYDSPGTYTLTLTVTDETGASAAETVSVTVLPSSRRVIFVSPGGNDSNDGSTEAKAVRSLSRAVSLLSDNAEIRIRRGSSYDVGSSQMIDDENVLITSYGAGADPTLWWTGPSSTYAGFLEMNNSSKDIVIERLKFDAPTAAGKMSVRGILPDGVNITVRNCTFGKVSDALNNERQPTGVLIQDNDAGAIGAYFSWCQGTDFSIIGNTVQDSVAEHNIRFGGVDRGLVYGNWLQNTFKACLWCMDGTYAYVAQNEFHEGPVTIGPNEVGGSDTARLHWGVVEQNTHDGQGFRAHSGVEHVVYRNNAVRFNGKPAFTINGTNDDYGRVAQDIRVINNTAYNSDTRGRFLEITSHVDGVLIANNMYVAPNLETGSNKTANVYIIETSLAGYTFRNNLWSTPKVIGWGDGWHYVYDYWSHRDGYLDMDEWTALSGVHNDSHRLFTDADISATFVPMFPEIGVGRAEPGIHTDLHGNDRSLSGIVCAGAVEN